MLIHRFANYQTREGECLDDFLVLQMKCQWVSSLSNQRDPFLRFFAKHADEPVARPSFLVDLEAVLESKSPLAVDLALVFAWLQYECKGTIAKQAEYFIGMHYFFELFANPGAPFELSFVASHVKQGFVVR